MGDAAAETIEPIEVMKRLMSLYTVYMRINHALQHLQRVREASRSLVDKDDSDLKKNSLAVKDTTEFIVVIAEVQYSAAWHSGCCSFSRNRIRATRDSSLSRPS